MIRTDLSILETFPTNAIRQQTHLVRYELPFPHVSHRVSLVIFPSSSLGTTLLALTQPDLVLRGLGSVQYIFVVCLKLAANGKYAK